MTRSFAAAVPLSRRFDAAAVRDGGTPVQFEATEGEREALARDFGLPGIDAFAAEFRVRREGSAGLRVTGEVRARLRQICVVSLDEFAADLVERVDVAYAPEAEVEAAAARAAGADETPDDDLPDPIVGGRVDLGALAAETMALGLDPYPRKPGAAFSEAAPSLPEPDDSPFASLRRLTGED